ATKGALATLTRNAAFALMPDRIRVNGINVGWMDTPGEHRAQTEWQHEDEDWLSRAEARQPFGQLVKPAHVAHTIAFLSSSDSGIMTGAVIDYAQTIRGTNETPPTPASSAWVDIIDR